MIMKFSPVNTQKISSRSGQSIVEAIVALSILTVGFLGIIGLLTKSFQLNRAATDQTQATYLASENIEVVKNLIDHDVYAGIAFVGAKEGWGTCFPGSGSFYYKIDYKTTDCSPASAPWLDQSASTTTYPIYLNTVGGSAIYSYGALGKQTIFTRSTRITVSPNEIDVQSTVYWTPGFGGTQSVMLEDHFYNWHPLN